MIQFAGKNKRSLKPLIRAALLLVGLSAAGFMAGRWSVPRVHETGGAKVSVNPAQPEKKKADFIIKESFSGHGGSFIPSPRHRDKPAPQRTDRTNWFEPGDTLSRPFTGEARARFIESGSGVSLGEGSFQVQGTVRATFTDRGLRVDTAFAGEPEVAVTLPPSVPKRYEVGILAGMGGDGQVCVGGYGRMSLANWQLGGVEISPWIGALGLRNGEGFEGYLLVGTGGRF